LTPTGQVGPIWTISASPLPLPRAHHGMAEADPGNSLVSSESRFVYVIGGQESSTEAPGGTATVFMASVDMNSGAVGAWTQLPTPLPEALVGPAVAVVNGFIYVVGGLTQTGTPSPNVYSAQIKSDGTLNPWSTSANPYLPAISFATAFGYAAKLYVLGGDNANSTNPNDVGNPGVRNVNFASTVQGVLGPWTATAQTIKSRKKHVTWVAFGQIVDAEGVYEGNPGSLELERTLINPDSTLQVWNGITSSVNQIRANVYNAAALVSPLPSLAATPRLLLLGGQTFVVGRGGPLSATVYYNDAP